ncbi:MAG: glycosyltransferase [Anaeromyxobacteraceae bacterium]
MKIAYVVNAYPRTSHSFIRREIQALEAAGTTVARFSFRPPDGELATPADREELTRTRVVLDVGAGGLVAALLRSAIARPRAFARAIALSFRMGRRSQVGVAHHLAYLAEACVLLGWFREEGVEHVHAHFGTNSTDVALLCHVLGGPTFSFTAHGPDEFDRPEALGLREKIREAAFAVGVSSYGRSQLWRWADPADWAKIHVVHCGLDRGFLDTPPSPVPPGRRLVCVARLSEQKGHLLLLEAAARLAREGLDFEIVLAGDGPLRPAIEAVIRREGLERCIRVAGWMGSDAVRELLVSSRGLVLPSFAEGLPVTIMESLALGRPVVTTSIAGIPELVEPGKTGWLVPPGSPDALVEAMRAILTAPVDELERMGREGAARVAHQHDAASEAARLTALFQKAVRGEP